MHKSVALACGVFSLLLTNPVNAAPSVFSAPTIKDYLIACSDDQSGCINKVGSVLMDKFAADGSTAICLPSPDYAEAVPKWLRSHPEMQNLPTEDGIYLTLKEMYPCG
jgi:hypothetical protein